MFFFCHQTNRETTEMLSATEILSASTVKGLLVEKLGFYKESNQLGVASCKLRAFTLKLLVKKYGQLFNCKNFETGSCESFL